jgi:hypothetical protein
VLVGVTAFAQDAKVFHLLAAESYVRQVMHLQVVRGSADAAFSTVILKRPLAMTTPPF